MHTSLEIPEILPSFKTYSYNVCARGSVCGALAAVTTDDEYSAADAGARRRGGRRRQRWVQHDVPSLVARLDPDSPGEVRQKTLLVSESGIRSRKDVKRLKACGARAILVGESLMREDDITAKLKELGGNG